jgi:hypothetical protein
MKRLVALVVLLGLSGPGVAWAKALPHHHAKPRSVVALAHVSYRARAHARKRPAPHGPQARSAPPATERERTFAMMRDPSGPPEHPGLFKGKDSAGWGFAHGDAETVVGLYRRPERPELPGPQIYHQESNGAAGLSVSLKLGH